MPRIVHHPVDVYVGSRVRLQRQERKVSQEALAQHLGVTFQQIQKYERGDNRISASKLFEIAQLLNISVGWFFDGLPEASDAYPTEQAADVARFMATAEALEVARIWPGLSRRRRTELLGLMRAMDWAP